jgi:diguanylate cyclase (GGDEF)-like protein
MKPLKKPVQLSFNKPSVSTHHLFENESKNTKNKKSTTPAKKSGSEIFAILTHDLPAEDFLRLTSSKKGIVVNPQDDILKRLLKLEKENHRLRSLCLTDELTGLNNKRFFNQQMKIEITRTKRTGQPFCLLFIDLDNFKSVNDTFGHSKGDEFLVKLCRLISKKIRPTDFACRYGGDEFTIILPATSLSDGISIAERWHELIEEMASSMNLEVSSSIGIDEFNSYSKLSADEFIDQVDQALYRAKATGKSKISHPEIKTAGSDAVTPAEREALYGFFVPQAEQPKKNT